MNNTEFKDTFKDTIAKIVLPQNADPSNHREQEKLLLEPFSDTDIEWRVQRSGQGDKGIWAQIVPYLDARAVQDRLDDVFGMDCWSDNYRFIKSGVVCTLSVKFMDKFKNCDWVQKQDGSDFTDIEPMKGGISSALKRAAVRDAMLTLLQRPKQPM